MLQLNAMTDMFFPGRFLAGKLLMASGTCARRGRQGKPQGAVGLDRTYPDAAAMAMPCFDQTTRTHARTHACTHARTYASTHARTHTRTNVRTYARTHARRGRVCLSQVDGARYV